VTASHPSESVVEFDLWIRKGDGTVTTSGNATFVSTRRNQ
jgi:hypothetical protein